MPDDLAMVEYAALRATIRERGTLRLILATFTFLAWTACLLALAATHGDVRYVAVVSLAPLAGLAAGFEAVLSAHVGVERIGRYIQARYEQRDGSLPAWEHAAMAAGSSSLGTFRIDPLFSYVFVGAALVNLFASVLLAPPQGMSVDDRLGRLIAVTAHALFLVRIWRARRFCATQRVRDLEYFRAGAPKL